MADVQLQDVLISGDLTDYQVTRQGVQEPLLSRSPVEYGGLWAQGTNQPLIDCGPGGLVSAYDESVGTLTADLVAGTVTTNTRAAPGLPFELTAHVVCETIDWNNNDNLTLYLAEGGSPSIILDSRYPSTNFTGARLVVQATVPLVTLQASTPYALFIRNDRQARGLIQPIQSYFLLSGQPLDA